MAPCMKEAGKRITPEMANFMELNFLVSFSARSPVSSYGDWMPGEEPEHVQDDKPCKTRTGHASGAQPCEGCARSVVLLYCSACEKRESAYRRLLLVWKTGKLHEGGRSARKHSLCSPVCVSLQAYQSPQTRPCGGTFLCMPEKDDEHVKEKK